MSSRGYAGTGAPTHLFQHLEICGRFAGFGWLNVFERPHILYPPDQFWFGPMRLIFNVSTVWNRTCDWKQAKLEL